MVDEISDIYNVLKPKLFDDGLKKGIWDNCLLVVNHFLLAFHQHLLCCFRLVLSFVVQLPVSLVSALLTKSL